ncbi:MAG: urate hydroxylase PuuD [Geminicoccaceae bacterium]|nr:urate hydroxylase PuuD [Geminicoccaceae bacterium]MCB9943397.1 urate hydroxylase PuuD [Geminicoccaceae bacterium]
MEMDAILFEWLSMGVRWLHVIAGIAWIGSSFYFVHLDLSLRKRPGLPEGAGGEAWQVHGGGFYNMVKYMVAPARMPEELTWFKWEAYTTWLSGFAMMIIVYYFSAELYLVDRSVLDISPATSIVISLVGLGAGWVVYDVLCKSPLGRNDVALAAVGFVFLVVLSVIFQHVFSGRGAFMQIGALIGTMMVANVAHVIIPNQRKVVAALKAGEAPDPKLGQEAKQRSLHNNYLTLPVIFVMIGNHYPLVFASPWMWLMLAIVLVMGAVIRHFFNTRHRGLPTPWWTVGVAIAGMVAIIVLSTLPPPGELVGDDSEPASASMDDVELVVASRCSMCHAREPLWEGIHVAPKGVYLETRNDIRLHRHAIGVQAVRTHAMPPGNVTGIDDDERRVLAAWLDAGAPVK